jgi:hydrogenase assembly chaperone HypC/HupF
MADNALEGTVLGVSWDGTGFGPDGTVWGGEFLLTTSTGFERVASLRQFKLPGADQAIREPRRSAFGLLHELFPSSLTEREDLAPLAEFTRGERRVLSRMVAGDVNAPATSSVGRLFDAVASITGLRQVNSFEGQAAMEMEFAIPRAGTEDAYDIPIQTSREERKENLLILDWGPMILAVLEDLRQGAAPGSISHKFHLLASACSAKRRRDFTRTDLCGCAERHRRSPHIGEDDMCLAIPGKVLEIKQEGTPVMGKVSFSGVQKDVCLEWLPDVQVGDYVIVHVGFAISKIDKEEALETLKMLEEMGRGLDELDESGS